MDITITPAPLHGRTTPPPSKSQAHRLLLAAALAEGQSTVENVAFSQDITATLHCLQTLGAQAAVDGSTVTIRGIGCRRGSRSCMLDMPELDCGESGSTLRFLIPVAAVVAGRACFTGRGRLLQRPQGPYETLFAEKGVSFAHTDTAIYIRGTLEPGLYRLPGNVSSQFFTGLLYALSLLNGSSVIQSTTSLESRDYIRMTIQSLEKFGVHVQEDGSCFLIPGGETLQAARVRVEADWSQAGFWYAAQGMGNPVIPDGLRADSLQPDRCIAEFSRRLKQPGEAVLDVSGCPDLVPPLAAQAALRAGQTTQLVNAARLRMKESDRLATVTATLRAMGAQIEEYPDSLTIRGLDTLPGGVTVSACNDHRIAMMAAVAASRCEKPVTVTGAECVAKSWPDFWQAYAALGGCLTGIEQAPAGSGTDPEPAT